MKRLRKPMSIWTWLSQHDDPAGPRVSAGGEVPQDLAGPKWEAGECRWCGREGAAIPARVGDEQDQVMDPTIPNFESELPFESLGVIDHGLRFDGQSPVVATDHRVPRSKVARTGDGNFGRPAEGRIQSLPQSLEKAGVRDIAEWVPAWVGAEGEVETEDLADCPQVDQLEVHVAALEPPEPGVINVGRRGHITQAKARANPGASNVSGNPIHAVTRPPSTPIGWPLASSHAGASSRSPLCRQLRADESEIAQGFEAC